MNAYLLVFCGFSALQSDVAGKYAEELGEVGDQMFIGPSFHRRCGQPDFKGASVSCARLRRQARLRWRAEWTCT